VVVAPEGIIGLIRRGVGKRGEGQT
jgi:hypothetical protein